MVQMTTRTTLTVLLLSISTVAVSLDGWTDSSNSGRGTGGLDGWTDSSNSGRGTGGVDGWIDESNSGRGKGGPDGWTDESISGRGTGGPDGWTDESSVRTSVLSVPGLADETAIYRRQGVTVIATTGCEYSALNDIQGTLLSPSVPGQYTYCTWKVQGTPGRIMTLTLGAIHTFISDAVEVFDGQDRGAPLIVSLTRNISHPLDICASSNTIFMVYRTAGTAIGFNATYREVDTNDHKCENTDFGYRYLHNTHGTIHSLDFPSPYPPNLKYSWNIRGTPNQIILFSFEVLDTAPSYDYVIVYDGQNEQAPYIGTLSGNVSRPPDMCTSGNAMFIRFASDGSSINDYIGFNATYLEVDKDDTRCQNTDFGYKYLHKNQGTIQSLNFPGPYPWDSAYSWIIQGRVGKVILLTFDFYEISTRHAVSIYDGWNITARNIGSFGGALSRPPDLCTSGNTMLIRFYANNNYGPHAGFNATYFEGDIMTGATCGAGDAHSSGTPDLAFGFCEVNSGDSRCQQKVVTVRLRNGSTSNEGRVEVFFNNIWGTICDDDWISWDAEVVCRMLGQASVGAQAKTKGFYGSGSGPIMLDNVDCLGNETNIDQCRHHAWGNHDCQHSEDAGVVCPDSYEAAITVDCLPARWNIHMYLPRLYKEHSDFDPSDIYLGRPGCQGYRSGDFLIIDQEYSNCLTHNRTSNNITVYTNALVYLFRDDNNMIIPGKYHFRLPVECHMVSFHDNNNIQNGVRVRSQQSHMSGHGQYTFQITFYSDGRFLQQLYGSPLTANIGENIYVSVTTVLSDWKVKMRVDSCYTLPSPGAMDLASYLIRNGCASDVSTHVIYISTHETRFVFRDFEYSSDQNNLYLYCTAVFCNTTDYTSVCDQSCHPSQTRSSPSSSGTYPTWAQTSRLIRQSKGRLRREAGKEDEMESSVQQQYISTHDHLFIAVILTAVGVSVIGVFVAVQRYRRSKPRIVESI